MGEVTESKSTGFESAFKLVGGYGPYQWICLALVAWQLVILTWNHMGYIFFGAVPSHWCHIQELDYSGWTEEQVKNLSIPKVFVGNEFKYETCHYYKINYTLLLSLSGGKFDVAYKIAHYPSHAWHKEILYVENENEEISEMGSVGKGACERWSYDKSIYASTIVTQFDLVCGRRYLVASIQAFYMLGAFLGTLVFGPLNDKILGRRRASLVGIVLVLIGGFMTALSTSYVMFIAMRFLVAVGTAGCMQATSIWLMEHGDKKSRAKLYCLSTLFFGVGYAIMPVYAYFIRDWSNLQLAFSLSALSLLSFYWIFPESPRWLASKGRDEEAVKSLERIARINRKPKPIRSQLFEAVRECHEQNGDDHELRKSIVRSDADKPSDETCDDHSNDKKFKERGGKASKSILRKVGGVIENFRSLCATKELRKISFTAWALFICTAFVYYGLAFSTNITSNPYLAVALGALMEIPACLGPIPFLGRCGRRPTLVACFCFTGLAALSIAATPAQYEFVRTICSMIGKLFIASAFTVIYIVVSEAYPTVVRSTGQGAGSLMGRFGSVAAPFAADLLTTVYPDLPSVIFGLVALAASLVAFLIPEMKNVEMKDQVYQCKQEEERNNS